MEKEEGPISPLSITIPKETQLAVGLISIMLIANVVPIKDSWSFPSWKCLPSYFVFNYSESLNAKPDVLGYHKSAKHELSVGY